MFSNILYFNILLIIRLQLPLLKPYIFFNLIFFNVFLFFIMYIKIHNLFCNFNLQLYIQFIRTYIKIGIRIFLTILVAAVVNSCGLKEEAKSEVILYELKFALY